MSVDIQAAISRATRKQQSGTPLSEGAAFMRGQRVAIIAEVDGQQLSWLDEEEGVVFGTRAEFRERALEGVSLRSPGSFLDRAWQIARAANLPAVDRLLVLRSMFDRAPDRESGAVIAGWMGSISLGEEPTR